MNQTYQYAGLQNATQEDSALINAPSDSIVSPTWQND